MHGLQVEVNPAQTVSLDKGLDAIRDTTVSSTDSSHFSPTSARSDPGFLGCFQCEQRLGIKCGPSRKRLGRIGRNIRQKLVCGFFTNEGNSYLQLNNQNCSSYSYQYKYAEVLLCNPKACWEVDPNQLPHQQ